MSHKINHTKFKRHHIQSQIDSSSAVLHYLQKLEKLTNKQLLKYQRVQIDAKELSKIKQNTNAFNLEEPRIFSEDALKLYESQIQYFEQKISLLRIDIKKIRIQINLRRKSASQVLNEHKLIKQIQGIQKNYDIEIIKQVKCHIELNNIIEQNNDLIDMLQRKDQKIQRLIRRLKIFQEQQQQYQQRQISQKKFANLLQTHRQLQKQTKQQNQKYLEYWKKQIYQTQKISKNLNLQQNYVRQINHMLKQQTQLCQYLKHELYKINVFKFKQFINKQQKSTLINQVNKQSQSASSKYKKSPKIKNIQEKSRTNKTVRIPRQSDNNTSHQQTSYNINKKLQQKNSQNQFLNINLQKIRRKAAYNNRSMALPKLKDKKSKQSRLSIKKTLPSISKKKSIKKIQNKDLSQNSSETDSDLFDPIQINQVKQKSNKSQSSAQSSGSNFFKPKKLKNKKKQGKKSNVSIVQIQTHIQKNKINRGRSEVFQNLQQMKKNKKLGQTKYKQTKTTEKMDQSNSEEDQMSQQLKKTKKNEQIKLQKNKKQNIFLTKNNKSDESDSNKIENSDQGSKQSQES